MSISQMPNNEIQLTDLLQEDLRSFVEANQELYISETKDYLKQCAVLWQNNEENAVPALEATSEFIEVLLLQDEADPRTLLQPFPELSAHLFDHYLKDILKLIYKVGYFQCEEVIEATNRLNEKIMLLSLKLLQNGDIESYSTLTKIFKSDSSFYTSNRSKCYLQLNPFGDTDLVDDSKFEKWSKKELKEGLIIDARKTGSKKKEIWSKAVIVQVEGSSVYVSFMHEENGSIANTNLVITQFNIAPEGSRVGEDWAWREEIKEGDKVDVLVSSLNFKPAAWYPMEVLKVEEDEAETIEGKTFKILSLKGTTEAYEGVQFVNVHSPSLRPYQTFSHLSGDKQDLCENDKIFDFEEWDMLAVTRTEGDRATKSSRSVLHSRFYVRLINIFYKTGGFTFMKEYLSNTKNFNSKVLGSFMQIIHGCTPFVLKFKIQGVVLPVLEQAQHLLLNAPAESVRDFNQELIENTHKAIEILNKRVKSDLQACEQSESFLIEIAMKCINSDFLDRKLYGISILTHIYKKIMTQEIKTLTDKKIIQRIKDEGVLTSVLKGHPSLIQKSEDTFKMLFKSGMAGEQELDEIWGAIRKRDLEGKSAIIEVLNNIHFQIGQTYGLFFLDKIEQVKPKELHIEEINFIFKISQFTSYRSQISEESINPDQNVQKATQFFWKVATDSEVKDQDLIKKATEKMISSIKLADVFNIGQLVEDALTNISHDRAVLQSLKILKKIMKINIYSDLKNTLISKNIISLIFENLRIFKSGIKSELESGESSSKKITEEINQKIDKILSKSQSSYEKNVLKRLKFIEILVFSENAEDKLASSTLNQIWEELVVNALVPAELTYFKKWFSSFIEAVTAHSQTAMSVEERNQKIVFLRAFFQQKISYLLDGEDQSEDQIRLQNTSGLLPIFQELFLRLNTLQGLIVEKVLKMSKYTNTWKDSSLNERVNIVLSHPDGLDGIDQFWKILGETSNKKMAQEIIDLVTPLYCRPSHNFSELNDINYRAFSESFIQICLGMISEVSQVENWDSHPLQIIKMDRALLLLQSIVDETTSSGTCDMFTFSSFHRGQAMKLNLTSNNISTYASPKKIEVQVFQNTTIFELRKKAADKLQSVSWKEISIERPKGKPPILKKHNGRNLRDIKLRPSEALQVVINPSPIISQEPLVIYDSINGKTIAPQAVRAFEIMFETCANPQGLMYPENAVTFIRTVLNENEATALSKATKFVQDNKFEGQEGGEGEDYITKEAFVEFYKNSSYKRPKAVRTNLKDFGFKPDFSYKQEETMDSLESKDLAGWHLGQNEQFMSVLLSLLDREDALAQKAWNLVNRLPPAPKIMRRLLSFEGISQEDKSSWNSLVTPTSPFKTMYFLYIIDYLMKNEGASQIDLSQFITTGTSSGSGIHKNIGEEYQDEDSTTDQSTIIEGSNLQTPDLSSVEIKKRWRMQFIEKGGFDHLIGVMTNFVSDSIPTKKQISVFTFILRILKTFILASATIKKPELYPCIQFVKHHYVKIQFLVEIEKQGLAALPSGAPEGPTSRYEMRMKGYLMEGQDFIDFRDSLKETLGENPIAGLDVLKVLGVLLHLSDNYFNKAGNEDMDEVSLIEHCLSISLTLLLNDHSLLKKATLSNKVSLLPENSSTKKEGYSDFISYILGGLLNKRSELFLPYFRQGLTILMRESGESEIQRLLLKIVLENIMLEGNSGVEASRYISLACPLLTEICSLERDQKTLLEKQDILDIVDLSTLFETILTFLLDSTDFEQISEQEGQELIVGYFNILELILKIEPLAARTVSISAQRRGQLPLALRIFQQCLFSMQSGQEIICQKAATRSSAYKLLGTLCQVSEEDCFSLFSSALADLSENIPEIDNDSLGYCPKDSKRSAHGYVGINNLYFICYMNSMLQQFYMTPAFRYGILAAKDLVDESMVDVKERKVDDNLFHQLQKMFAYLDISERKDFNPQDFCFSFKDYSGEPVNITIQEDTQEFLNRIFEKLENILKPTPFKDLLNGVYGGKNCNVFTCSSCKIVNKRVENFYNISLDVKNFKSIHEGLEQYIQEDVISDYKCGSCGNKCDYVKRSFVKDVPNVLIVHMKRLTFDYQFFEKIKINTRYAFPMEINLKNISLQQYEEDLEAEGLDPQALAGRPEEQEVQEVHKGKKEGGEEPEAEPPVVAERHPSDYYDYELKGVLVHSGTAEQGHYYSYININRTDPARPHVNKDKWLEFNDSDIRSFKVEDIESECFGEGNTIEKDNDLDFYNLGSKFSSNKNAYILVYEKKEKTPLKLIFDEENLGQKEQIIENFVKEDQRSSVVESVEIVTKKIEPEEKSDSTTTTTTTTTKTTTTTTLEVAYHGIQQYIPENLLQEINQDNFRFNIEQHVYSGAFLTFLSGVTDFGFIPDFKPKSLENRIYQGGETPSEYQVSILKTAYTVMYRVFNTILSNSSELASLKKFTTNFMRMMSYCPEVSSLFLTDLNTHFQTELPHHLISNKEARFGDWLSKLISHAMLVYYNHYQPNLKKKKGSKFKYLLYKMASVLVEKKKTNYKYMGPYFRFWNILAKGSEELKVYLITQINLVQSLIVFYNKKKSTGLDTRNFCVHEKALDPLLATLSTLLKFVDEQRELMTPKVFLNRANYLAVLNTDFIEKLLSENYSFNNFRAVRNLVPLICKHEELASAFVVSLCLKHLSSSQRVTESSLSYYEAIKELALIEDEHSLKRRDFIFGVPTVLSTRYYNGNTFYGVSCFKNLQMPVLEFKSMLTYENSQTKGLLCNLISNSYRQKSLGVVLIHYLLEIVNNSEECFNLLMKMPSPFATYSNFYGWLFVHVDNFVKGQDYAYTNNESLAKLYVDEIRDNLKRFESDIISYLHNNYPDFDEDYYRVVPVSAKQIYMSKSDRHQLSSQIDNLPVYSPNEQPLIGSLVREAAEVYKTIRKTSQGNFRIKFKEMVMNVATSKPTGDFNNAFPRAWKEQKTYGHVTNPIPGKYMEDLDGFTDFSRFLGVVSESVDGNSAIGQVEEDEDEGDNSILEAIALNDKWIKDQNENPSSQQSEEENQQGVQSSLKKENISTSQDAIQDQFDIDEEGNFAIDDDNEDNNGAKAKIDSSLTAKKEYQLDSAIKDSGGFKDMSLGSGVILPKIMINQADTATINDKEEISFSNIYSEVPDYGEEKTDGNRKGLNKKKSEREKLSMDYYQKRMALRISVDNTTGSAVACSFRLISQKNTNLYMPLNQFSQNFKNESQDETLIYLLKINPNLPFGDFQLQFFYKDIEDNQFYTNQSLFMGDNVRPLTILVEKSYEALTTEEEEEEEEEEQEQDEGEGEGEGEANIEAEGGSSGDSVDQARQRFNPYSSNLYSEPTTDIHQGIGERGPSADGDSDKNAEPATEDNKLSANIDYDDFTDHSDIIKY